MTNNTIHAQAEGRQVISTPSIPVKVLVEDEMGEEHRFFVPASLISHCKFFKDAKTRGATEEDQHLWISLGPFDPTVFTAYIYWLNTGQVLSSKVLSTDYSFLAEFYGFAVGEAADTKLQDRIVDAIMVRIHPPDRSKSPWLPNIEFVNRIYDCTESIPGSPARRLMVDTYVKGADGQWLVDHMVDTYVTERDGEWKVDRSDRLGCHPQFFFDLSVELLKQRKLSSEAAQAYKDPATGDMLPFRTKSCFYHTHRQDDTCGATEG